jgi:hypothetical protein
MQSQARTDRITAEFHFVGSFHYGTTEERQHALDSLEAEPAPIPAHLIEVEGLTVHVDYKTSSVPSEWPNHLLRAAHLAIHANAGELVCTYEGPSDAGPRVQLVKLTPRGGHVHSA